MMIDVESIDNGEQIVVRYVGEQKPTYQTIGSAGADVCSAVDLWIPRGEAVVVQTDLRIELPPGYECQVRSRSGLASKHQVFVLNSPGCVDSDYRGEVGVILMNLGPVPFYVKKGDRIAQLVFSRISRAAFVKVPALSETARSGGGFGSTGK